MPKLTCYAFSEDPPPIVPAPAARQWMDDFSDRHAYRCLPLSIANTHGWQILSPCSFTIHFTGGLGKEDITFEGHDDYPHLDHFAMSNFTRGVVTFHTGYLFRTEPGWNLFTSGPFNEPKDGIYPLTGLIETDWLPYPFTMNWQLTRPGEVRFERGEPFCHVFPVPQALLDEVQPEIVSLDSDQELKRQYEVFRDQRRGFMAKFNAKDPETLKQAWQRYYFRGRLPGSDEAIPHHRNKVRLKKPIDLRAKIDSQA
jgi:Family of unknown function (DUF6065)